MKKFLYMSPKENILFEMPDQLFEVFNQAIGLASMNTKLMIGGRRFARTFDVMKFYGSLPSAWKQQIKVKRNYKFKNGTESKIMYLDEAGND